MKKSAPSAKDSVDEATFSVVPFGVQRNGLIVDMNQATYRALGRDPAVSLVGTDAFDLVHPCDREWTRQNYERIMRAGRSVRDIPCALTDGAGNPVPVLMTIAPLNWKGTPAMAVSFALAGRGEASSRTSGAGSQGRRDLRDLSAREYQIALLVAQGFSIENVSAQLRIHSNTVRQHIKSIYRKTKTHSRVELTRLVLSLAALGLLPDED